MTTYGDVWKACEAAFAPGTRFDVDVSGHRSRTGEVRIEWTVSHYGLERGSDLRQIEGATADEVIAQLRALGGQTTPDDVGAVGP